MLPVCPSPRAGNVHTLDETNLPSSPILEYSAPRLSKFVPYEFDSIVIRRVSWANCSGFLDMDRPTSLGNDYSNRRYGRTLS